MLVCFDGPDGCGKTTMARELSKQTSIPYFRYPSEKFFEADPKHFVDSSYGDLVIYEFLRQTKASVVFDRSYPSDFVYAQVFDRPLDWKLLRSIDDLAASADLKIVVPYRSSYVRVRDQFASITLERLNQMHQLYLDFGKWTKCNVLRICVDDEDLKRELMEIRAWLVA